MRLATLVLPVLLLSTACSVKKNMDDMHEKTIEMADTTQELQESTAETKDVLAWVSIVQKQGGGHEIRSNSFEELVAADTLNLKLARAKSYYYAFDFQVANYVEITGVSLVDLRNEFLGLAVSELGKVLPEVMPSGTRWKLDGTDGGNKNQSLMAMAATMHEINVLQGPQSEPVGLRPLSMMDIVLEGLAKKPLVNSGRLQDNQLSKADKEVLREEQIFTHLLRLRVRALAVIALGRISNIQDGIFRKFGMLFTSWEPRFDELNAEQIEYAALILERAQETRVALERMDIPAELDGKVERILKRMKSDEVREKLDNVRDAEKLRSIDRFDAALAKILNKDA
jgi:hypothetical protein